MARSLGAAPATWTREAYERKLINVAACLRRILPEEPALVALTEVESQEILDDLAAACGWTHMRSVDAEAPSLGLDGLDVALLYNEKVFHSSPSKVQSVSLDNRLVNRDLVHARLELREGGAVEVAVVHWPSRMISEGVALRLAQAFYLRRLVESSLRFHRADVTDAQGVVHLPSSEELIARWLTPFILMGDFNDDPYDDSIRVALNTTRFADRASCRAQLTAGRLANADQYLSSKIGLHNPSWNIPFTDTGTMGGTFYRDSEWRTYDQIIVSHGAMSPDSGFRVLGQTTRVARIGAFKEGELEVRMANPSGIPNKFEPSDLTGVSDHFPVLVDVEIN